MKSIKRELGISGVIADWNLRILVNVNLEATIENTVHYGTQHKVARAMNDISQKIRLKVVHEKR